MKRKKRVVAVFDFDKTLTHKDLLIYFLAFVFGWPRTIGALMATTPWFIRAWLQQISRQSAKEQLLTNLMQGSVLDALRHKGMLFALTGISSHLNEQAMSKLRWHQSQGDRCVLVSANLDVFLEPWAQMAGFQDLICSTLETNKQGCLTGKLLGANCWGAVKAARLQQLLGKPEDFELYVYGDSQGDKEILAMADHPFYRSFTHESVYPFQ